MDAISTQVECTDPTRIVSHATTGEQSSTAQYINPFDILTNFPSYTTLRIVIAWSHRLSTNARSGVEVTGRRNARELEGACMTSVKLLQQATFVVEIALLDKHQPLSKTNKLISLNVFLDAEVILRVDRRLCNYPTMTFIIKHTIS